MICKDHVTKGLTNKISLVKSMVQIWIRFLGFKQSIDYIRRRLSGIMHIFLCNKLNLVLLSFLFLLCLFCLLGYYALAMLFMSSSSFATYSSNFPLYLLFVLLICAKEFLWKFLLAQTITEEGCLCVEKCSLYQTKVFFLFKSFHNELHKQATLYHLFDVEFLILLYSCWS